MGVVVIFTGGYQMQLQGKAGRHSQENGHSGYG
jgi:hypothetical protein